MTERLYHAGIRATLWHDAEAGEYIVTVIGHDVSLKARTYDDAIARWEETARTLAGMQ